MTPHTVEPRVPFCHVVALAAARTGLEPSAERAQEPHTSVGLEQVDTTLDATCGLAGGEADWDRVPELCLGSVPDEVEIFAHTAISIERLTSCDVDEPVIGLILAMPVDARELDLCR